MQCKVFSLDYAECAIKSVQFCEHCGIGSVECVVCNIECEGKSVQCRVCIVYCEV